MGTVHLSGRMVCSDLSEAQTLRRLLPEHISQTRNEPGCISFDVSPTDNPLIWHVDEHFESRDAFQAHQARSKESGWARATESIGRDYTIIGD